METDGSSPHSQQPIPFLSQINLVHASPSHFLKIHFNVILPSGLLPLGLPTQNLYELILSPIGLTCPAHRILVHLITRMIFREEFGP